MKKIILALTIFAGLFMVGCDEDDEPTKTTNTQPQELCDSLNITYDAHIKAIVDMSCNTASCHASSAGGFKLGTYAEVKAAAEKENFLKAIKHEDGAVNMPMGASKLSDENIQKFECWEKTGFTEK
mgnify:CR=1 FL=1